MRHGSLLGDVWQAEEKEGIPFADQARRHHSGGAEIGEDGAAGVLAEVRRTGRSKGGGQGRACLRKAGGGRLFSSVPGFYVERIAMVVGSDSTRSMTTLTAPRDAAPKPRLEAAKSHRTAATVMPRRCSSVWATGMSRSASWAK